MSDAQRTVTIGSSVGLHARPASLFVQSVTATGHTVTLAKGGKAVNASSILGVLGLAVGAGEEVELTVSGDDAEKVADELAGLLSSDLDAA